MPVKFIISFETLKLYFSKTNHVFEPNFAHFKIDL